jgi:hypothetical protein
MYHIWEESRKHRVGKAERKRPLVRHGCRWKYNIKINPREIRCGMKSIRQTMDRGQWQALLNVVINLWVPPNARKFLGNSVTVCFSRQNQFHGVKSSSYKNARMRNKATYCAGRELKTLSYR